MYTAGDKHRCKSSITSCTGFQVMFVTCFGFLVASELTKKDFQSKSFNLNPPRAQRKQSANTAHSTPFKIAVFVRIGTTCYSFLALVLSPDLPDLDTVRPVGAKSHMSTVRYSGCARNGSDSRRERVDYWMMG